MGYRGLVEHMRAVLTELVNQTPKPKDFDASVPMITPAHCLVRSASNKGEISTNVTNSLRTALKKSFGLAEFLGGNSFGLAERAMS